MDNKTALVLIEMFATPTELGLLKALRENPNDEASRRAYIDYLRDNGREGSADDIEKENWIPTIGHVYSGGYKRTMPVASGMICSGVGPISLANSGEVGAGSIGSGRVGLFHFASGTGIL